VAKKHILDFKIMPETERFDFVPVLTAAEMAELDRKTIEEIGLPVSALMENAGRKIVESVWRKWGGLANRNIAIFCGKGNNGGDGFVVARWLANSDARVTVILLAEPAELHGAARTNYNVMLKYGVRAVTLSQWQHQEEPERVDLAFDAILGTGVKGSLRTKALRGVEALAKIQGPIVAVDLPTGMNADTGQVSDPCVHADMTVTLGELKRGLLFSPGREYAGHVVVADIGFPRTVVNDSPLSCFRTTGTAVQKRLPQRRPDTFKNRCGRVFVLAGSEGMTGAAVLCSQATLRAGGGLTILGVPASLNGVLEEKLTEIMTLPLPETDKKTISVAAKSLIAEKIEWADVLAVGPGFGTHDESKQLLAWLLQTCDKPMVLDADALNCLAADAAKIATAKAPLVLTPHPGEFARLTQTSTASVLADPVGSATQAANEFDAVVVLKGGPTVTASPDGLSFINSTGNPGMATAGMGDVLTGVIASLLGQGMSPLDGALTGVFIHGLAGDLALQAKGERGLIASDVLAELPAALQTDLLKIKGDIEYV